MITIVDYGMGNVGSLINIFRRIGVKARAESDPKQIEAAEKLVLPGVGSFDAAMARIGDISGLREVLNRKALIEKIPVLGICLGMQLLTDGSDEGARSGLGWIPGRAYRFPVSNDLKVPHMGWNGVTVLQNNGLTQGLGAELRYYFVHSYYVRVENSKCSMLRTKYGIDFDSGICMDNIFGLQFHPEKSHRFGMNILQNFSRI